MHNSVNRVLSRAMNNFGTLLWIIKAVNLSVKPRNGLVCLRGLPLRYEKENNTHLLTAAAAGPELTRAMNMQCGDWS